jgi:hypothetical protein
MSDKKQTAVQYLIEEIKNDSLLQAKSTEEWNEVFQKAKEMEREQIEKSYTSGREQWQKYEIAHCNYENDVEVPTPRKYYNETYGGQDEN